MRQSPLVESSSQHSRSALATLVALSLGLLPLVAVVVTSRVAGIKVSDATRDAIDVMGAPAYVGFVSNLGMVVWVVAATSCLFAAALIAKRGKPSSDTRFLVATGLLTSVAAADDIFLIHERVITPIAGGSEGAYAVLWAALLAAYSAIAGRSLLRNWSPLLVVIATLFLLSVGIDLFAPMTDMSTFLEDSAKYLGIVVWAVYVVPLSYRMTLSLDPARVG